jgi:hypothetical protein
MRKLRVDCRQSGFIQTEADLQCYGKTTAELSLENELDGELVNISAASLLSTNVAYRCASPLHLQFSLADNSCVCGKHDLNIFLGQTIVHHLKSATVSHTSHRRKRPG